MSEAIEQAAINKSPLDQTHWRLGATFAEREGWLVPVSYGGPKAEYAIVREGGPGLIDLSSRGRVEVRGAEATQFLNGLVTNDIKALQDGAAMNAAFPNVQGRLQAYVRIIRRGDAYLFDTEAVTHARVVKLLERFTLAGDFYVADLTPATALISLQGSRSAEPTGQVLGQVVSGVEHGRAATVEWKDRQLTVMRATHTAEDGFDIFVDADVAPLLWDTLTGKGARPVGFEALETLRIEAGVPRFGVDMDESRIVLEAGLEDAVSFTKGCYIGQEIIARIHWRGHIAKRLAGLTFANETPVDPGARIRSLDGKEIGEITSAVYSPRLDRTVALGYIKYDYLAPGTRVNAASADTDHAAEVTALPFVRGSWFEEGSEPGSHA
jgi:folate-binding protein YgfZ